MTIVLRTAGLTKRWGGFVANADIDFSLVEGERHALIGPNGAGKTTFINLLTGGLAPTSGDVYLGELCVTGLAEHERVHRGLSRTFQINTLFPTLTVLESVVLAICERKRMGVCFWRTVASCHAEIDEAHELITRLGLTDVANLATGQLAYGKQRLVEIALALATKPRILLLDEPAAGIPSTESGPLFEVIDALPREVTILFIEHDMDLVFRFAQRITVLVAGRVLTAGTPDEIAANAQVREVYLGEHADA
jgi:branched-chain amino acid transport system ATP-binding protein